MREHLPRSRPRTSPGRPRPRPAPDPFALHLDCGIWRASCPAAAYELAKGKRQDKVERKAARRPPPAAARSVSRSPDDQATGGRP